MRDLYTAVEEACGYIRKQTKLVPEIGIIFGTGLGNVRDRATITSVIDYKQIPHFPQTTVESHKGNLVFGTFEDKPVVMMEGRFHYYEGYSLQEVTFPVRVMKALGVKILIITNAAGGMKATYERGDIVVISDHINLSGLNPLVGVTDERLGSRFPDMSNPYDNDLRERMYACARELQIDVKEGVYVWVTGPSLETRAEYKFMHKIGADLVGMSTVPEVIVGVQCGLQIVGLSCITDVCIPETLQPVDISEIIRVANDAGPKMDRLIQTFIASLP